MKFTLCFFSNSKFINWSNITETKVDNSSLVPSSVTSLEIKVIVKRNL